MHITVPYSMIEPIREVLDSGLQSDSDDVDERWVRALREDVLAAKVDLECDVVSREITLRDIVNLKDRKSTRLNSSHVAISYAVCGLKKKDSGQYSKILIRAKQLNVKISNYEYAIHQASRDDATNMISAEECSRNSIRHIHIT